MGIVRTKGIVIKIANSSEHDKILTVLTADRGKIRVFCKGAKKTKSAFLASTEFLSFSDMMLFEGNGEMYNLNSAEPINVFYNLRSDIDKLMYASVIAQIMNDVCQEEELCFNRLQLLLNTLYVISETEKDPNHNGVYFFVSDGDNWDSAMAYIYFIDDENGGVFRLTARFFGEASEGHGNRFRQMIDTFKVIH